MSEKLSVKPKIFGLSKNKILIGLGILGTVIIIMLGMGIFDNNKSNDEDTDTKQEQYSTSTNANSSEQILEQVNHKISKESASAVVRSSLLNDSTVVPAINGSQTIVLPTQSMITPPISNTDEQQFKTQVVQAENQFKLHQIQNKYAAYSARIVVYNNQIKFNESFGANVNSVPGASNSNANYSSFQNNQNQLSDYGGINNSSQGVGIASNDQNNQSGKRNFAATADRTINGVSNRYLNSQLEGAVSPYIVFAGSVIPATMISGLNSDLPGQITAFVRQNVYDSATHQILLIPQGAKLIGLYDSNITYGQERILVAWNRLIYPDGSSINLKAMPGTDLEGYAGFYDQVDNHYWKIFGTTFVMGAITAAMQYSQNNTNANAQVGGLGVTDTNTNPTIGQTLSGSLGQQLGQTGLSLTQKNLKVQPTLIIRPNYQFNIMLTADIILKPVNQSN